MEAKTLVQVLQLRQQLERMLQLLEKRPLQLNQQLETWRESEII